MKLFCVNDSEWILAETKEEAQALMTNECGIGPGDMEIEERSMALTKVDHDEMGKIPATDYYDHLLTTGATFPMIIGGSE